MKLQIPFSVVYLVITSTTNYLAIPLNINEQQQMLFSNGQKLLKELIYKHFKTYVQYFTV